MKTIPQEAGSFKHSTGVPFGSDTDENSLLGSP
jgi:hypothetical protein